jgi:hypothetical protein
MLAGVTGPPAPVSPPHIASPTLQYPERTEDKEDECRERSSRHRSIQEMHPRTHQVHLARP